jgi:hypothetical protein
MTADDQLIPLRRAAEIFLGHPRHVATLRAEAARGNLVVSKIGRSYWTTLTRLKEMDKKCQGDHLARVSGSTSDERPSPSSMVDPTIAQGSALRKLDRLSEHFGITSRKSISRPAVKRRSSRT